MRLILVPPTRSIHVFRALCASVQFATRGSLFAMASAFALFAATPIASATPIVVYDDALRNGVQDWSWATHDLQATAQVHGGVYSVSMVPADWEGIYFHHPGFDAETNGTLGLWIHGGPAGGQQLRFYLYSGNQPIANAELEDFIDGGAVPAGHWARAVIPFTMLGIEGGTIDGLVVQADAAETQPTVYLDDLILLDTGGPAEPVTVTVDPTADRRPIDPLIYGVNFGSTAEFGALPFPLRRWGGNAVTRYNWMKDATNRASDWFFLNLPEGPDSTMLPEGSSADLWIEETLGAGADAILTVPMIGWTARDRVKRWGFSIAKYGPQQQNECSVSGWPSWCEEDAGNGVRLDGSLVTGNDPHDTSVEIGPPFVQGWIDQIAGRVGAADDGGVRFYALDNEPALWNHTHRDVRPNPLGLDELWTRTQQYAEAVREIDPSAAILGPAVWGWCEYFYSAVDGCQPGADMQGHGGLPLLEWYLAQNRARELQTGVRPVDYLDIHYYPQAQGVALSDDESVAALRLRSLRSLYDPGYVDESWIGQPVRLIPRMKEWIAARCPGVKLAITEYNWGGDEGISSALAQAEVLAIFGREGVDLATRWVAPRDESKVMEAFRLFLDYDGAGSSLDGESVRALSSDSDDVGAYAILRPGDARVAVLLFNKATGAREISATVAGAASGSASAFRFDAATALGPIAPVEVAGNAFTATLSARSATLFLVPLALPSSVQGDQEEGGDRAAASAATRLSAEVLPTPFHDGVTLTCDGVGPAVAVGCEVFDTAGRRIRIVTAERSSGGRVSLAWDGRDATGAAVASGVYFLRVSAGDEECVVRALRLRE